MPGRVRPTRGIATTPSGLPGGARLVDVEPLDPTTAAITAQRFHALGDIHRGVTQHTNGFYNVPGWLTVSILAGVTRGCLLVAGGDHVR